MKFFIWRKRIQYVRSSTKYVSSLVPHSFSRVIDSTSFLYQRFHPMITVQFSMPLYKNLDHRVCAPTAPRRLYPHAAQPHHPLQPPEQVPSWPFGGSDHGAPDVVHTRAHAALELEQQGRVVAAHFVDFAFVTSSLVRVMRHQARRAQPRRQVRAPLARLNIIILIQLRHQERPGGAGPHAHGAAADAALRRARITAPAVCWVRVGNDQRLAAPRFHARSAAALCAVARLTSQTAQIGCAHWLCVHNRLPLPCHVYARGDRPPPYI